MLGLMRGGFRFRAKAGRGPRHAEGARTMIRRSGLAAILIAGWALTPLGPATAHAAGTVTVTTCDESHLRSAITSAGAGGTVTFGCGTAMITLNPANGPLVVTGGTVLTIDG